MKKAILILSLFFLQTSSILQAQLLEHNDQTFQYVQFTSIQNFNGGNWLLGGNSNSGGDDGLYLVSIDSTSVNKIAGNFYNYNNVDQLVISSDFGAGYILIKDDETYLARVYNALENPALTGKYTFNDNEEILKIEVIDGNKVIALGRKTVDGEDRAFFKIFKNSFQVEFADYTYPGYYSDYQKINDSTFYVTGSNLDYGGRKYNQYYEDQGLVLENLESDRVFPLGEFQNEGYFFLKDKTITKTTSSFIELSSVNFESYGEMIDMEADHNFGYLLFQDEGEVAKILKIDGSLQVVSSFDIDDELFVVNELELSDGEIGIGGYLIPNIPFNNTPFLYPHTSGFFKVFSKNGISSEREMDLEIADVKIEDHEKNFTCGSPDQSEVFDLNLKNIKVTMINRGTKTINKAEIFVEAKGMEECSSSQITPKYHRQKDDLTLLRMEPGDTLIWRISAFEFSQSIQDSTEVELCIWATTVENERDKNDENNYFCGKVTLGNGYFETPIVEPTNDEFLIYPNPLKEIMKVSLLQAPFEPTLIEFYDYLGREVGQRYFIAARAKYKEFDISQLPSGFYYMRISNDVFEDIVRVYMN